MYTVYLKVPALLRVSVDTLMIILLTLGEYYELQQIIEERPYRVTGEERV
jgi:hypothetical protein